MGKVWEFGKGLFSVGELEAHDGIGEDAGVHLLQILVDHGLEAHLRDDVALDVDARSNFDEVEAVSLEREDRAFGDVADVEAAFEGDLARERRRTS